MKSFDIDELFESAKELKSEGDNPEYDRALVELCGYMGGYTSDDFWLVARALGIESVSF